MYFTQIKEVEREISFRTEQGLYYNAFKTIINSDSITQGIKQLMSDKTLEYPHTLNLIERLNIYQEIFLAVSYRVVFKYFFSVAPIQFYLYSIFYLQILQVFSIFLTTYCLTDMDGVAGVLSAVAFVVNKIDTTRVESTAPLRESFALPFLSLQIYFICRFLKSGKSLNHLFLTTFIFSICWQFNQFLLLLQAASLYILYAVNLVSYSKLKKIFLCGYLGSLGLAYVFQFFNPMIPRAILISFIISTVFLESQVISKFVPKYSFKQSLPKKIISGLSGLVMNLGLTFFLNFCLKMVFKQEADSHIFKIMEAKTRDASKCTDFDASLYVCNGAFGFLDWSTYGRLNAAGLLGVVYYAAVGLFIGMFVWYVLTNSSDENGKQVKEFLFSSAASFVIIQSVAFWVLAVVILRMKFVWTPYVGVVAAYALSRIFRNRVSKKAAFVKYLVMFSSLGYAVYWKYPAWVDDFSNEFEFHDPDTVQFLEWITENTAQTSVFSSSMQVASMIRLSTNRAITNHPHYEDKRLRDTTFDVYQMYAKIESNTYKDLLAKHGTTHIVVENSICFQQRRTKQDDDDPRKADADGCITKKILDRANGHLNVESGKYKRGLPGRFCEELKKGDDGNVEFKKVFENHTFLIYEIR